MPNELPVSLYDESSLPIGSVTNPIRVDPTGTTPQPVTGSITVIGTTTVDIDNTATLDYDTGGGTVNQVVIGIALPGSGGPVAGGTATAPVRVDPTGSTAQPVTDNGGSLTVDGTVAVSSVAGTVVVGDGGGSLTVDGTVAVSSVAGTVTVAGTVAVSSVAGTVTVADGGGSLTVDGTVAVSAVSGTVAVTQSTSPWVVDQSDTAALDYDTGGGTVNQTVLGIALPGSGGPVAGGTATAPVRTDPTGTTAQPITDNGGSLTVDGTVAVSSVAGTVTVAGTVAVSSVAGTVTVADGGGSLTVDGTVAVSAVGGTVAVTQSTSPWVVDQSDTAAIDYDTGGGTVNQTVLGIALPGSGGPVAGGTATAPVRVDPTGTTAQPITDNGGSLTVDGTVAVSSVAGTVTVGDGGGSLTVDGTVAVSAIASALPAGNNLIGQVQITDGVTIASVRDLTSSNPQDVAIVDGSGNQITSFGGGVQYTDGDVDTTPTGTAVVFRAEDSVMTVVNADAPLPVQALSADGLTATIRTLNGLNSMATFDDRNRRLLELILVKIDSLYTLLAE